MSEFIKQAIEAKGSQKSLADACGVSQVSVHKWLHGATLKPEHAISVEQATEGQVTRQQLRPDIFGDTAA